MDNLTALGLLWDGVGIFVLGIPALFRVQYDIEREAGNYLKYNIHELRNRIATRVDIGIGSILLMVGFVLQLLASYQVTVNSAALLYCLWGFCPVFLAVYYGYARWRLIVFLADRH